MLTEQLPRASAVQELVTAWRGAVEVATEQWPQYATLSVRNLHGLQEGTFGLAIYS
jgi:hypothetical protein